MITLNASPLISVGLPTYNRPESLKRAVACILSQTYNNLEIIISDNCSTYPLADDMFMWFEQQDSRIKVFRQKKNIGLALNFQFVLSKATGKYFMWMSDDDFIDENFILVLSKVLEQFPSVNLAFPALTLYNAHGEKENTSGKYISLESDRPEQRVYDYFKQPLKMSYFYGLYRREVIQQFEFTPKMFGADILLNVCMAFSGKVLLCAETSYTYYMGGNSFDTEKLAKVIGLSSWKATFWGFNDAIVTAKTIMRLPAFKQISLSKRFVFCIRVGFLMLRKTKAFRSFFIIVKRKVLIFLLHRPVLKRL